MRDIHTKVSPAILLVGLIFDDFHNLKITPEKAKTEVSKEQKAPRGCTLSTEWLADIGSIVLLEVFNFGNYCYKVVITLIIIQLILV